MAKSSNASASAFGWDFQSNAAIILMIKNIKLAKAVKVEGDTEDIEITLHTGKTVYAQAKAVFNQNDSKNSIKKLTDGLKTLNEAAKNSDVQRLMFVTNSPNPFNDRNTMYAFASSFNNLSYSDLPESCKEKINEVCDINNFLDVNYDFLSVVAIKFHGDEENRYQVVKDEINEFLNSIELGDRGLGRQTLLSWQNIFTQNASKKNTANKITKKDMIWPLIVAICKIDYNDAILSECDEGDFDEIKNKYGAIIASNSERFEFLTKVMSKYESFGQDMTSRDRTEKFISQKWMEFKEDFSVQYMDEYILEKVIKITLSNVIKSRRHIKKIKTEVNLT